jgi:hypothetical protein
MSQHSLVETQYLSPNTRLLRHQYGITVQFAFPIGKIYITFGCGATSENGLTLF